MHPHLTVGVGSAANTPSLGSASCSSPCTGSSGSGVGLITTPRPHWSSNPERGSSAESGNSSVLHQRGHGVRAALLRNGVTSALEPAAA